MIPSDAPRVLVLGAGSIGSRHARNLVASGAKVAVADVDPARAAALAAELDVAAVPLDPSGVPTVDDIDGVVVATPSIHHADQAAALLARVPRLLVEKPLVLDPVQAAPFLAVPDRVAVAYNLRFHPPVRRLVDRVHTGDVGAVRAVRLWFGSWLPDWRPGTDYRQGYSARRDLGGGVLFDAIHELDLLVWLCGTGPHEVAGAVVDRVGPLEIDVEDTVRAVIRTPAGVVADVALDLLSRRYRRGIEVIGDEATLRLDWARATIERETAAGVEAEPADDPVARSYERQADAFVAWLRGGPSLPVDAVTGLASVSLAAAIRDRAR